MTDELVSDRVYRLDLGIVNAYLVDDDETTLLDAGTPNAVEDLRDELDAAGYDERDLDRGVRRLPHAGTYPGTHGLRPPGARYRVPRRPRRSGRRHPHDTAVDAHPQHRGEPSEHPSVRRVRSVLRGRRGRTRRAAHYERQWGAGRPRPTGGSAVNHSESPWGCQRGAAGNRGRAAAPERRSREHNRIQRVVRV